MILLQYCFVFISYTKVPHVMYVDSGYYSKAPTTYYVQVMNKLASILLCRLCTLIFNSVLFRLRNTFIVFLFFTTP